MTAGAAYKQRRCLFSTSRRSHIDTPTSCWSTECQVCPDIDSTCIVIRRRLIPASQIVLQDTLRAARQGLAERDFLVAAHEHSEAALAGAAASLRAELAATAGELTAVFAKVDELAGVAAANGAVVRGLRSDAAARLQVLLHWTWPP